MHTKMISDDYIRALYMNTKTNKTSNRNLTKENDGCVSLFADNSTRSTT